mmetsp:Transcript_94369/g.275943  ORF Transcript_94369/g.275943 Transcript_94369/m.275943 type:complete len:210 (-) Transcript_94369:866-1495(-)
MEVRGLLGENAVQGQLLLRTSYGALPGSHHQGGPPLRHHGHGRHHRGRLLPGVRDHRPFPRPHGERSGGDPALGHRRARWEHLFQRLLVHQEARQRQRPALDHGLRHGRARQLHHRGRSGGRHPRADLHRARRESNRPLPALLLVAERAVRRLHDPAGPDGRRPPRPGGRVGAMHEGREQSVPRQERGRQRGHGDLRHFRLQQSDGGER